MALYLRRRRPTWSSAVAEYSVGTRGPWMPSRGLLAQPRGEVAQVGNIPSHVTPFLSTSHIGKLNI